MRLVLLFCLAGLALVTVSAVPTKGWTKENCRKYSLPLCTREFDPVCGDDDQEYSNECMLCFRNWEKEHDGEVEVAMAKKGPC